MKFKLENIPEGVMIGRVMEALTQKEATTIVSGIEKVLANGKARIVLEFAPGSAGGEGGASFLEKSLRPLKTLAKKMGGDLLFVVPGKEGETILGSFEKLDRALKAILEKETAAEASLEDRTALIRELRVKTAQFLALQKDHAFLQDRVAELVEIASQPTLDRELKAGIEHYKSLAAAAEEETPNPKK